MTSLDPVGSEKRRPAPALLCPERKRFGGRSEKGCTFMMDLEDGNCMWCHWPPDLHTRALADESVHQRAGEGEAPTWEEIKRAAKAIFDIDDPEAVSIPPEREQTYVRMARAALDAARQPKGGAMSETLGRLRHAAKQKRRPRTFAGYFRLLWRDFITHGLGPDTERCEDCGRGYVLWHADEDLWERVRGSYGGLLCPSCFDRQAWAAGFSIEFRAIEFRRADPDTKGEGK